MSEPVAPGRISLTNTVPLAVPSVLNSSWPVLPLSARKNRLLPEMVNIVGGSAKAKLSDQLGGEPMQLSLPTMIRGNNFEIQYPSGSVWTEVGFLSDCGPFRLCVTFAGDVSFKGA